MALVIVAGVVVLSFGAGSAFAQGGKRAPTELWQEYPLDPTTESQDTRSLAISVRIPALEKPASTNTMLRLAGFALVAMILADTLFLSLSATFGLDLGSRRAARPRGHSFTDALYPEADDNSEL